MANCRANEDPRYSVSTLYVKNEARPRDMDPATVSEYKIWRKLGVRYKCPNCGHIPICVDVRDLKKCPKCEIMKTFYESDGGLMPMYIDREGVD